MSVSCSLLGFYVSLNSLCGDITTVAQKYERVHKLGNRKSAGNSFLKSWEERPFNNRTISSAGVRLSPRIKRCRWSGMIARCSMFQSWLAATSRRIRSSLIAISPISTAFRRLGHQIRWYSTKCTRWLSCLYSLIMFTVYHVSTNNTIERGGGRFLYGLKPIASTSAR